MERRCAVAIVLCQLLGAEREECAGGVCGGIRSSRSRATELYKRAKLPSRTLSLVISLGILSDVAVRGTLAFAGEGPFDDPVFSVLTAPLSIDALNLVGLVAVALPAVVAVVVGAEEEDEEVVVGAAVPSGFLFPPTSFFHFLTVSFARSATALSS